MLGSNFILATFLRKRRYYRFHVAIGSWNCTSIVGFRAGLHAAIGVYASGRVYHPGAAWEKGTPEAAGYSGARLELLRGWLKTLETTGMMVVVGGRVIFEYGNVSETSKIASVRKSVLGMLFGKCVAKDSRVLHATVKDLIWSRSSR